VLTTPIQGIVVQKLFGLNRSMVKHTDERVRTTNEALQGIQSVKMFAWESNFAKTINQSRQQELSTLRRIAYLRGFSRAFISALPGVVAATSFVVYALTSTEITASKLFAALVAFDQLRFPLLFYPLALANLAQASVSAGRLQRFLEMSEVDDLKIGSGVYERNGAAKDGKIVLDNATVYWSDPKIPLDDSTQHSKKSDTTDDEEDANSVRYPKPVLKNVSCTVETGKLCAVVGRVASGKSTLASAILGEALLESGTIKLEGRTAYAAQSPWILNASLRDNILFGLPYDKDRYEKVIDVCQLRHDLSMLDNGDLTEIGEKGINLSGGKCRYQSLGASDALNESLLSALAYTTIHTGQKQRVSVARAAYSDADTIIFDDPLSALDPEVGQKLFSDCILQFLGSKTRLFITNQLQFLKFCDTVVALHRGKVVEQGNYEDLAVNKDGEVYRLLRESSADGSKGKTTEAAKEAVAAVTASAAATKIPDQNAGVLVTKEERAVGAVPLSVYLKYIGAGGGGWKFAVVYMAFVLTTANGTAIVSWISVWTR
jgi:ABC-type multidrug transport system fused ATPase/permease subunit